MRVAESETTMSESHTVRWYYRRGSECESRTQSTRQYYKSSEGSLGVARRVHELITREQQQAKSSVRVAEIVVSPSFFAVASAFLAAFNLSSILSISCT